MAPPSQVTYAQPTPKVARHNPNVIEPIESDQFLRYVDQQEPTDILNTEVGFGATCITNAYTFLPNGVHQLFQDEQPRGSNRANLFTSSRPKLSSHLPHPQPMINNLPSRLDPHQYAPY